MSPFKHNEDDIIVVTKTTNGNFRASLRGKVLPLLAGVTTLAHMRFCLHWMHPTAAVLFDPSTHGDLLDQIKPKP